MVVGLRVQHEDKIMLVPFFIPVQNKTGLVVSQDVFHLIDYRTTPGLSGFQGAEVILVGDEAQLDLKPFQTLREQYDQVEWDYKQFDQHHNPEPYIEICLKQNAALLQSYNTSQTQLACNVKGAERWTDGECPVDLYQVGTFGSCLSSLRSRIVWPTQGNFIAKGAPRYYQARLLNGGTHLTVIYPEEWAQSPLLIETFLHIQTWHTRYPQFHKEYALELNVTYASVVVLVFTIDTLSRHQWSVDVEWATDYAQVDIIRTCGIYDTVVRLIWAMDYAWRRLPQNCDPDYTHCQLPPGQHAMCRTGSQSTTLGPIIRGRGLFLTY